MATIQLTIPDNQLNRVIDAVCNVYGFDPNGALTKQQFAKGQLVIFCKNAVKTNERTTATAQAITTVDSDVDTNVTIT